MTRIVAVVATAMAVALALPVGAEENAETEDTSHEFPLGSRTRTWLDRQASGVDASPNAHGLTPPANRRARQRYLNSFEHPIPLFFEAEDSKDEGN